MSKKKLRGRPANPDFAHENAARLKAVPYSDSGRSAARNAERQTITHIPPEAGARIAGAAAWAVIALAAVGTLSLFVAFVWLMVQVIGGARW
jgi:hypothetical protein